MASASSSLMKVCIVLFFLLPPTMLSAVASTTTGGASLPSPVKCIHHHASLISCVRYLKNDDIDVVRVSKPTEACCRNYGEIFRSGTPTCLCRYLHPEKVKTWFNVTKLMSLHDVCSTMPIVPLYDLCLNIQDSQEKFNGILQVVNNDIQVNPHYTNVNPFTEA
ncbi:uncharacterized protein G2W53_022711 [Senna tora]|uniref:Bifunctional inhibitor/plant lipid transfer protein/seed storage helical domain-containing protein n=1 Tax=Senna tora TaxID=362788 RepID=A0A834TN70_9FABA|nr:uncharacterized protein G2W53_022711 [Senna tora]